MTVSGWERLNRRSAFIQVELLTLSALFVTCPEPSPLLPLTKSSSNHQSLSARGGEAARSLPHTHTTHWLWQEGILVMDRCSYIKRGLCVTVWSPNEWNNESSKKVTKLKIGMGCFDLPSLIWNFISPCKEPQSLIVGLRVAWLVQDWDSMKNVLLKDDLISICFAVSLHATAVSTLAMICEGPKIDSSPPYQSIHQYKLINGTLICFRWMDRTSYVNSLSIGLQPYWTISLWIRSIYN